MKRRVVIRKTRLQYVLESTIKKRRKNMKLKKILAQSLAVAMVLSSVPVANFTAFAAEDTVAYASDDASTVDATTDAFPAPYGYKNLQLTVGTDVEITTSANTEITESSGNNILKDQFCGLKMRVINGLIIILQLHKKFQDFYISRSSRPMVM
jgi:hypothetical protein